MRSSIPLRWRAFWLLTRCRRGIATAAGGRAVDRPADGVRRAGRDGADDDASAPPLDGQLQGYLDHLTIERGVAANTLSSYRRDLRRYSEHLTAARHRRPGQGHRGRRQRISGGAAARRSRRRNRPAVGGVCRARPDRGAWAAPVRRGGGARRTRRRAGGQAADTEPPTAQEPQPSTRCSRCWTAPAATASPTAR